MKEQVSNKFDISPGLVVLRQEELIRSRNLAQQDSMQQKIPLQSEIGKLTHPTRNRPTIPNHRPPSKQKHHPLLVENSIFSKHDSIDNLISSLKEAIATATKKYRDHYENGNSPRQPSGWFSWLRHGKSGQLDAEDIFVKTKDNDSPEAILMQLESFFKDMNTKYNNHSFAAYLLDELNNLLQHNNFLVSKPKISQHYDARLALEVTTQLQQLGSSDMSYLNVALAL